MKVLLDTCVLSELRRTGGNAGVRRAVESLDDSNLFISVISIGEIAKGIALLSNGGKKRALQNWLQTLEQSYADQLIPIDVETGRIWGEITVLAQRNGRTVAASDGLIAATAVRHGLHVMTRNITDFELTGVLLINPWPDT